MKIILKTLFAAVIAIPTLLAPMHSAQADEKKMGLFVNLTTDDTWAAAKAISFAHHKALKNGYKPVAIWLNVRAVYLADKKRASHVHGLMAKSGKSIQNLLTDFMADGGQVIMCGVCSKAAGLTKADYIDGVVMGKWPLIESLLFNPKVKTLAW
ncbi:MAG: DsrE family protein [Rhizobiaceae bacterium]